jgi:hypothetical protein
VRYVELRLDHPGCGALKRGEEWRAYCHPDEFPPIDDLCCATTTAASWT